MLSDAYGGTNVVVLVVKIKARYAIFIGTKNDARLFASIGKNQASSIVIKQTKIDSVCAIPVD